MLIKNQCELWQEQGVTVMKFLRVLTLDEVLGVVDYVAANDDNHRRMWVLSENFRYTREEVTTIAARGRKLWPDPALVAYVASDDLGYGALRMLETLRDEDGYQIRVFRDETAALVWLTETVLE